MEHSAGATLGVSLGSSPPTPGKLRSTSCDGPVPPASAEPCRIRPPHSASTSSYSSSPLRAVSSPPTPLAGTLATGAFPTTLSPSGVSSYPSSGESGTTDQSDLAGRFSSRFSSGFSSASSDSAETSLTSLTSHSYSSVSASGSRQASPRFHAWASNSTGHLGAVTTASGVPGVGATGLGSGGGNGGTTGIVASTQASGYPCATSLPSSPLSFELGADTASQSWPTPGTPSLSNSLVGSFFLPAPAMMNPTVTSILLAADADAADETELLAPPANFGMVAPGVYRSSFPKLENFDFLRSLGLKSVMTLVQEKYPEENSKFLESEGIRFFQFSIPGNKEPFVQIPEDKVRTALACVLDVRNHPMLIHCNKGKHRTGCIVGCLRKMQHWSSTAIFDEYRRYSFPKSRNMDQQFIELFDQSSVWGDLDGDHAPLWLDQSA